MISSFIHNNNVGMTKDAYFEMCETLGSEPDEDEIPVEVEDFPVEVQTAITIYNRLRDEWEGMSGTYMGKSFAGLKDILDIYEIDQQDRKYLLEWIEVMDIKRNRYFSAQRANRETSSKE